MDIKDVLKAFDIEIEEKDLTPEKLAELRDQKFIGRAVAHTDEDLVKKITGKYTGSIETKFKSSLKELGVELTADELKDKKIEDIITLGSGKLAASLEELKKKGSEGNDKKLNDLQKQFEDTAKKLKDTEGFLEAAKTLVSEKDKEKESVIKSFKLNHIITETKSKVPFSDSFTDLSKRGFDALFNEKYVVELGDNDAVIVKDKKTGDPVKNANKTDFIGFEELYKQELTAAGGLKVAGSGGGTAQPQRQQQQAQGGGGGTTNYIPHPKALENEASYKK
jgi:hypothetical protein